VEDCLKCFEGGKEQRAAQREPGLLIGWKAPTWDAFINDADKRRNVLILFYFFLAHAQAQLLFKCSGGCALHYESHIMSATVRMSPLFGRIASNHCVGKKAFKSHW
jgi:hypothetical protein